MQFIECYDVGGTNIRAEIFEDKKVRGKPSHSISKNIPTDRKNFVKQIIELSRELNPNDPSIISIGVPGPVEKGNLLVAPPLGVKEPINLEEKLSKALKKKVLVENDLNLATKAELHYGYGKIYKNFYLLTISTGIGSGLVLDGKIVSGKVGEFGHNTLHMGSEYKCICGHYGCWAAFSAGSGIENRYYDLSNKKITSDKVFKLSKLSKEDMIAEIIVADARRYNAAGIGTMINAFSVEAIVVMGSVGLKQFSKIIPNKKEIAYHTVHPIPKILKTKLGDRIGVLGAYIHASNIV